MLLIQCTLMKSASAEHLTSFDVSDDSDVQVQHEIQDHVGMVGLIGGGSQRMTLTMPRWGWKRPQRRRSNHICQHAPLLLASYIGHVRRKKTTPMAPEPQEAAS